MCSRDASWNSPNQMRSQSGPYSLSGYGPIISGNRPGASPHDGRCGAGRIKNPPTRLNGIRESQFQNVLDESQTGS